MKAPADYHSWKQTEEAQILMDGFFQNIKTILNEHAPARESARATMERKIARAFPDNNHGWNI